MSRQKTHSNEVYMQEFFFWGGGVGEEKSFIVSKQKNTKKYKQLLYTTYITKYKIQSR